MALAQGEDVPEVHLVWSCARMAEMKLVGEALPSMLVSAGAGADVRFKTSLFCSGEVRMSPVVCHWLAEATFDFCLVCVCVSVWYLPRNERPYKLQMI